MQEKIVPLIRAIKTKEPAVAIAALNVLRQVGGVVDADFVAMDVLPVLWNMSLGPLLNLQQFQSFMELIKSLSARVESEQSRKLQELSGSNGQAKANEDFMSFGASNAFPTSNGNDGGEVDFEQLVKGNVGSISSNPLNSGWESAHNATAQPVRNSSNPATASAPSFSWSTPGPSTQTSATNPNSMSAIRPQPGPASRTITPDLSRFDALTPSSTQFSQPLQPQANYGSPFQAQQQSGFGQASYNAAPLQPQPSTAYQTTPAVNWGAPPSSTSWSSTPMSPPPNPTLANLGNSMSNLSMNQQRPVIGSQSSFSLPPPPGANTYKSAVQQSTFPPSSGSQGQSTPARKNPGIDTYE